MLNKMLMLVTAAGLLILSGCASVPMAPVEEDQGKKEFSQPSEDMAGVYIYRNSRFGGALKKTLYLDGEVIGETAPKTYFYRDIKPGNHVLSTESEFGENDLQFVAEGGKNYYVKQSIKLGVFVGGAKLGLVTEEEGQKGVLECKLAN